MGLKYSINTFDIYLYGDHIQVFTELTCILLICFIIPGIVYIIYTSTLKNGAALMYIAIEYIL